MLSLLSCSTNRSLARNLWTWGLSPRREAVRARKEALGHCWETQHPFTPKSGYRRRVWAWRAQPWPPCPAALLPSCPPKARGLNCRAGDYWLKFPQRFALHREGVSSVAPASAGVSALTAASPGVLAWPRECAQLAGPGTELASGDLAPGAWIWGV